MRPKYPGMNGGICGAHRMQFDEFRTNSESGKQFREPTPAPARRDDWASFFDVPNVGFVVCDESLRYVKVNDASARMHGIPAEAHLGKTVHDILGDAAAKVASAYQHVFA